MLLTVENLSLTFDKKQIFNNASFRVLPNEKIGVVGNNGVGKTTLINVLCGKIIPDSGKIDFEKKIKLFSEGKLPSLTKNAYHVAEERDLKNIGDKLKKIYEEVERAD